MYLLIHHPNMTMVSLLSIFTGQAVLSVTASDVNANHLTEVVLTCVVNYTGMSESEITIEKVEGSFSAAT